MPITKMQERKLRVLISRLKIGPASLRERSSFMPGGDGGEQARVYLQENYDLWLQSWITPHLNALLPENKKGRK